MPIDGLDDAALLHEVLVAPRDALVPMPSTRVISRPGFWQVVTPELTRGGMNQITATHLEGDVEEAISQALLPYESAGLLFRWEVPPGVQPPDLGERLLRRGLHRSEGWAMACDTTLAAAPPRDGLTVERVDGATVGEYTQVMAQGWSMDPAPLYAMHTRLLADPNGRFPLFLARCGGAPAGVGTYAALPRSAYLMGAVVLPEFRGQGLYRALVQARLRDARARGLGVATTFARAHTSAPLLAHMGFVRVAVLEVYANYPG